MKKKTMKKIPAMLSAALLLVLSFALLTGCSDARANPYESDRVPDSGYTMRDVTVTIDASAGDRSLRITEKYAFVFEESSQGFYRDIPVNSGEQVRNIRLLDAAHFYNTCEVSHEDSVVRVRVGKEGYYRTGGPFYATLSYTLYTPVHAEYPDAVVVNAIGQGWSCEISHATVHVLLPAETIETPRYYYGAWGENKDACNAVTPLVSQKPVTGLKEYTFEVTRPLPAYNGLTLYYFLPKGALSTRTDLTLLWIVLGGFALVGILVLLKVFLGRSPALTPITNYYPPKHAGAGDGDLPMDPVDMGYLIDGTCQGSDVTSLIFYFAAQGYLEIISSEGDDDFTLRKVCDLPDGRPKYQYTFFNKLFTRGDTVTVSDLTNRTYTAVQSVQSQISAKYGRTLYDGKAAAASFVSLALTVLFATLVGLFVGLQVYAGYIHVFGLMALFPAFIGMILVSVTFKQKHKLRPFVWVLLAIAAVLATVVLSLLLLVVMPSNMLGLPARLCLVAIVASCSLLAPTVRRRTASYTEELNEILGFKEFLLSAEKERLEMLLEENPQYYYDILPYANVLGVSDIWQDKFENLTLQPPAYMRGTTVFSILWFNRCYRHSYRAYSTATVSRPSSSSHSGGRSFGGGGGGFSGGGFGGGGGGRW